MSKKTESKAANELAAKQADEAISQSVFVKLLKADRALEMKADKLDSMIYQSFIDILSELEPVLKSKVLYDSFIRLLSETFKDYPAKLARRKTMFNNARHLTTGKEVNKKQVAGIGYAAMLKAAKDAENKTLLGLGAALNAVKPDSMKDGNSRGPVLPNGNVETVQTVSVKPVPIILDDGSVDASKLSHVEKLQAALRYLSICNELLTFADGDEDLVSDICKIREKMNRKIAADQKAA
jgi:hypothetical protein